MKSKEYYIAYTKEEQDQFLNYLKSHEGYIAVDTETTSANSSLCDLMGVSISIAEGEAFYFVVREFKEDKVVTIEQDRFLQLQVALSSLFTNPKNHLIMHNSSFDVLVLRRTMEIDCLPQLHADTILMKHTINEQKKHGLKDCAAKYLGPEFLEEQADLKESVLLKGGKWNMSQKDMYMADTEILGKYACADADMTARLFTIFDYMLTKQGLSDFYYKEEVHPLNEVVIDDMVGRGVKCDIPYFIQLKQELTEEAAQLEREAHEDLQVNYIKHYEGLESELLEKNFPLKERGLLFKKIYLDTELPVVYNKKSGEPSFTKKVIEELYVDYPEHNLLKWKLGKITKNEFEEREAESVFRAQKELYLEDNGSSYIVNLSSNAQLKNLLFERLGEQPQNVTSKGNAQVDEGVMTHFAQTYVFIDKLLKLRKIKKLLSTYVEAILTKHVDEVIHPSWLQFGTDSGRFACKNPNFQNLPRDDNRIKKGIIARTGYNLVGADYSQLEPRIFSHYSQEKNLIDAYKRGDDFYGTVAVLVHGYQGNPNTMKKDGAGDLRQQSKGEALAIAYGAKKWRLASMSGTSIEEAQTAIDAYWSALPNLEKFVNRSHGEAITNKQVKTEAGRVRRFEGIDQLRHSRVMADKRIYNKLLNLSVNFKIQSTAGSIVNRAMITLKKRFKELGLDAYVLIQIHDEIVCEARKDQVEQVKKIMKDVMENNYKLDVPLVAEPNVGDRLSETK